MYLHFRELEADALLRQQLLLQTAARQRLLRRAGSERRAKRPPSPSLRAHLAAALRALAVWIDDRTQLETGAVEALA